jgi:hypothetical protein
MRSSGTVLFFPFSRRGTWAKAEALDRHCRNFSVRVRGDSCESTRGQRSSRWFVMDLRSPPNPKVRTDGARARASACGVCGQPPCSSAAAGEAVHQNPHARPSALHGGSCWRLHRRRIGHVARSCAKPSSSRYLTSERSAFGSLQIDGPRGPHSLLRGAIARACHRCRPRGRRNSSSSIDVAVHRALDNSSSCPHR